LPCIGDPGTCPAAGGAPEHLGELAFAERIARFHAEPVCGHCGVIIGFGFADPATVLCAGRGYRLSSMLIRRPPTLTGQIAVTLGVLVAVNGGG
jgi:hypothetical protein